MNPRGILGFVLGLVAVGILVSIGVGVYQAGVAQGVVDAGRYPETVGVPINTYGWHGPGIFGILFGIFFLFLIFGLIRAAFFRGRGYGPGWGGHGYGYGWGPGWAKGGSAEGSEAWRAERDQRITDLHRRLHEDEAAGSGGPGSGSAPGGSSGGGPAR